MVELGPAVSAFAEFLDLLIALHVRREEAAIIMLLEAWQQSLESQFDVSNDAERDGMTVTDVRGIEVDLNDLRPVGIELGPGKICSEQEQHITVEDSVIAGGLADEARHPDIVGIVMRHKVLAPRGVGHWRLQPRGGGDHFVVRAGTAGAGIDRDRLAPVEDGRDLVEVGVTRANDRPSGMDGI